MGDSIEIVLPDIGDHKDVPIVEINVAVGDDVVIDTPLLSIESDKATMEVPSPAAGKVKQLMIEVGGLVSQGSILMILEAKSASGDSPAQEMSAKQASSAKHAGAVAQEGAASVKVRERPEPSALEDRSGLPEVVGRMHHRRFAHWRGNSACRWLSSCQAEPRAGCCAMMLRTT